MFSEESELKLCTWRLVFSEECKLCACRLVVSELKSIIIWTQLQFLTEQLLIQFLIEHKCACMYIPP